MMTVASCTPSRGLPQSPGSVLELWMHTRNLGAVLALLLSGAPVDGRAIIIIVFGRLLRILVALLRAWWFARDAARRETASAHEPRDTLWGTPVIDRSLFDAYVVVDWSAAATPKTGADSVWVAGLERRPDGARDEILHNPPTRQRALLALSDRLADLVARDRRVLVGIDAALGFPAGFAALLRPDRPDWRGVWTAIAAAIVDLPNNGNNRFQVAANLNAHLSGRAFPFWGCPAGAATATLSTTKPKGFASGFGSGLAEYRLTDRRVQGPQSVWKLAYVGSVGSQTLLAIAYLERLRADARWRDVVRIWPFETGLTPLRRSGADTWRVVIVEVWPSIIPFERQADEPRDAAQVRALARHFARLDEHGSLASLLAGPADLSNRERAVIEREEAWILGIETAAMNRRPAMPRRPIGRA